MEKCGKKQGELDFLLERDADIIPVEVKFGKAFETQDATLPSVKVPLKINNELFFDLLKDAIATY